MIAHSAVGPSNRSAGVGVGHLQIAVLDLSQSGGSRHGAASNPQPDIAPQHAELSKKHVALAGATDHTARECAEVRKATLS